jgi:hypothetical protein
MNVKDITGGFMKKTAFLLVIAFLVTGAVFAQDRSIHGGIAIEGTLQLQNGQIAVSDGNTVYFVPVLNQYSGFTDGLRVGSDVTVIGYVTGNVIRATQVTVNGKSYDFQAPSYNGGPYVTRSIDDGTYAATEGL